MKMAGRGWLLKLGLLLCLSGCTTVSNGKSERHDKNDKVLTLEFVAGSATISDAALRTPTEPATTITIQSTDAVVVQLIDTSESEILDNTLSHLEHLDLNFDGLTDFRYPLYRTAGPVTVYEHWLWSNKQNKYVSADVLNDLGQVNVNQQLKQLTANWRDGQSYGSDVYQFEGSELVLVSRSEIRYLEDGGCVETTQNRLTGQEITSAC